MQAFWMNPDNVVYAATTAADAAALYEAETGEPVEEYYPQELTDAELDTQMIKHDASGNPTEFRTSIREYLDAATKPGFLCGMDL